MIVVDPGVKPDGLLGRRLDIWGADAAHFGALAFNEAAGGIWGGADDMNSMAMATSVALANCRKVSAHSADQCRLVAVKVPPTVSAPFEELLSFRGLGRSCSSLFEKFAARRQKEGYRSSFVANELGACHYEFGKTLEEARAVALSRCEAVLGEILSTGQMKQRKGTKPIQLSDTERSYIAAHPQLNTCEIVTDRPDVQ
jgi:hypothetical protein